MRPTSQAQHLVRIYQESVQRNASRPLFGVRNERGWRWLSYRDFGHQVSLARSVFSTFGLTVGDHIAVISHNSPDWAVLAFAAYGSGLVHVPVHTALPVEDWLYILDDADVDVVFVDEVERALELDPWRAEAPERRRVVCLCDDTPPGCANWAEQLRGARESILREPDPEEICALIYTSGSTGQPKGVALTHRALASNVVALHQIFPITETDRSLSFLPWSHAFGLVAELHALLATGASLALVGPERQLMRDLAEVRPTLLFSVPTLFNRLHDAIRDQLDGSGPIVRDLFERGMANARRRRRVKLAQRTHGLTDLRAHFYDRMVFSRIRSQFGGRVRYAFSGGAPLAPEVAELVDAVGITLYEGYGLTEAGPVVSANWPGARRIGSVGKPIPGVHVEIDHAVGADSTEGEIQVRGPCLMQGYRGLQEESQAVLGADGALRTGDLGYLDRDGFLFITGRVKEQFKLESGRYVAPAPLEAQLCLSRFIENVLVHGDGRPHNVALVVPDAVALRRWATVQGLGHRQDLQLLEEPMVRRLYDRELRLHSEGFRHFEMLGGVLLLPEPFDEANGLLTPTQKLRRARIVARYADQLDELYGRRRGLPIPSDRG